MVTSYRVEIDLKPIDEDDGMVPASQSNAPWSYGREEIPDFILRKGIPLGAWEQAVDGAQELVKDRNVALQRAIVFLNLKIQWQVWITIFFAFAVVIVPGMLLLLLIQRSLEYAYVVVLISVPWATCFPLFRVRHIMAHFRKCLGESLGQISSEFEEKWADQVRDLNFEYQKCGITVETSCRSFPTLQNDNVPWSNGFVFSFEMQPRDEQEAAWFLACCRIASDSDTEFQRRTVRVKPADQPVVVATTDPGGTYEMAVAVIVDDQDVYSGHGSKSENINLKSTPSMDLV